MDLSKVQYEWYIGIFVWGKKSRLGDPIRIEHNHAPIIDPALRFEIEKILNRTRHGSYNACGVLPLSGLVYSFTADGEVVPLEYSLVTGKMPRYIYSWEYNRSVPGSRTWSIAHHLLEEPIFSVIFDRIVLPDYADRVAEELEGDRQRSVEAAARYRAACGRLEKEIKNLQSNFALISHPDDITSIQRQIVERRKQLEKLAVEMESQVVGCDIMSKKDVDTYRQFLADLPTLWETAGDELRNRFLGVILNGVYIVRSSAHFDVCIAWYNGDVDYLRVYIPPKFRQREKWTAEDEVYLRANYATMELGDLQAVLNRSERAIRKRAFDLGLKRPPEKPRTWTDKEREVFERYSRSEMSYEQMRRLLSGRTEPVIFSRTKDWGLPHPDSPYWELLPSSYGEQFPNSRIGRRNTAPFSTR